MGAARAPPARFSDAPIRPVSQRAYPSNYMKYNNYFCLAHAEQHWRRRIFLYALGKLRYLGRACGGARRRRQWGRAGA